MVVEQAAAPARPPASGASPSSTRTTPHYQPGLPLPPVRRSSARTGETQPRHAFITDGVDFVVGEVDRRRPAGRDGLLVDGRDLRLRLARHRVRYDAAARPDTGHARPAVAQERLRLLHLRRRDGARARRSATSPAAVSSSTSPRCRSSARSRRWSSPSSPTTYLRQRGLRDRIEIVFVTPLRGAFTKPVAAGQLGRMLDDARSLVETDFLVERIDQERDPRLLRRARGRLRPARHVPLNMGADFVARSGLGDELNYVPVDKHTMRSTVHPTHLRPRRRQRHPGLEGRLGRALLGRALRGELPRLAAGEQMTGVLRRARELLRRVRRRQGAAPRLQLRHRAADREVSRSRVSAR